MGKRIGFWDGLDRFRKEKEKQEKETGKDLSLFEDDKYYSDRYKRALRRYDSDYYDSWGFSSFKDETSQKEVIIPSLEWDNASRIKASVLAHLNKYYIEGGPPISKAITILTGLSVKKNFTPNFVRICDSLLKSHHAEEFKKLTSEDIDMFNHFYHAITNQLSSTIIKEEYRIRDIFKLYYNKDIVYDDKNKGKTAWLSMLLEMDTYYMKVSTNNSYLYSSAITKNIIKHIAYNLTFELFMQNKDKMDKIKEKNGIEIAGSAASNDITKKDISDLMNNLMGSSNANKGDDESKIEESAKEIVDESLKNDMSSIMSSAIEDANEDYSKSKETLNAYGLNEGDVSIERIESLTAIIDSGFKSDMSKNMLSKFIKSRIAGINKGMSSIDHFKKVIPIEFIESDDFFNFDYYEALIEHSLLPDAESSEFIKTMKYDIYVDTSGSMNAKSTIGGSKITRLMYAQMLVIRMIKYNFIDKIFGFEDDVYQCLCDTDSEKMKSVFQMRPGGGTSFYRVIDSIIERKRPSLIITDGGSNYGSDKTPFAYVMQLGGTKGPSVEQVIDYAKGSECGKDIIKSKRYCVITDDGEAIYPN